MSPTSSRQLETIGPVELLTESVTGPPGSDDYGAKNVTLSAVISCQHDEENCTGWGFRLMHGSPLRAKRIRGGNEGRLYLELGNMPHSVWLSHTVLYYMQSFCFFKGRCKIKYIIYNLFFKKKITFWIACVPPRKEHSYLLNIIVFVLVWLFLFLPDIYSLFSRRFCLFP